MTTFHARIRSSYVDAYWDSGKVSEDVMVDSADTTIEVWGAVATYPPGAYIHFYDSTYNVREVMRIDSYAGSGVYNVTRDYTDLHTTNPEWGYTHKFVISDDPYAEFKPVIQSVDVSTSVKFGTQLPGGFSSCTFTLFTDIQGVFTQMYVLLGADVTIFDDVYRIVWEGFVSNVSPNPDQYTLEVTCSGYYAKANDLYFDMLYTSDEATTNLVPNPSFEIDISSGGWYVGSAPGGSSAVRYTSDYKWGTACLKLTQPSTGDLDLLFCLAVAGLTASVDYTISFYAKALQLEKVPYIVIKDGSGADILDNLLLTGLSSDGWTRYIFPFTNPAYTSIWIYFYVPAKGADTYQGSVLIDGVQLEQKGYATPYCDGTLDYCYWNGTAHNSTSYRVAKPVYQKEVLEDVINFVPAWRDFTLFVQDGDYDVGPCDFYDRKAKDAVEYVTSFGRNVSGEARAVHFALWENRVGYLVTEPDIQNTSPNWILYTNREHGSRATASINLDGMYNKIYSVYADIEDGPTKTVPSEDSTSQSRYGIREGYLQNGDLPYTSTQSYFLQEAALTRYKYPRAVQSFEFTGKALRYGLEADYVYKIRAGDIILMADLGVTSNNVGAIGGEHAYKAVFFVLRTEYDSATDVLRVDVGSGDTSFDVLMGRIGISGGLS